VDWIPPHSIEREEKVLAAALLGEAQEVVAKCSPQDFYKTAHRQIFEAIQKLLDDERPIDVQAVFEITAIPRNEIAGIMQSIPVTSSGLQYIPELKELSARREIASAAARTLASIERTPIPELVEDIETAVEHTRAAGVKAVELLPASKLFREEKRDAASIQKYPTDLYQIDQGLLEDGLPAGLHFLGGGPGVGKTTLACQFADAVALAGDTVLYAFGEGHAEMLQAKGLARFGKLPFFAVTRTDKGYEKEYATARNLYAPVADFIFYLPMPLTIARIEAALNQLKSERVFVVIDHLQLIKVQSKRESRRVEIDSILRELMELRQRFSDCLFLVLSEISRSQQGYDSRRGLDAFKESGDIEFAADCAWLMRENVHDETQVILRLAKNRLGATGEIELLFRKAWASFEIQLPE